MKQRKTYWRRKNNKIIAEGQRNKKTIYLFTLPNPEQFIRWISDGYLGNPKESKNKSFLTKEKIQKIMEKINRLDYKQNKKDEGE